LRHKCIISFVLAVKVPLDAYMMDFVFSEKEDGGIFDNKYGMDYHIPVFGGIVKEPPMHIVHISVEMAPIAKVSLGYLVDSWIYKSNVQSSLEMLICELTSTVVFLFLIFSKLKVLFYEFDHHSVSTPWG
jgi:starch synthase